MKLNEIVNIADLDCIYLSYDEPQKEEFWVKIKNMVPWAKRVDGVHGSDAAHKAAADCSETERFVLIDGDNLPDIHFFDLQLKLDETNNAAQFRWKARNSVNDLRYGNGGISCWTRTFVHNMKTHENTDGRDETNIEFCFDPLYWPMHDCYSTTYINYTPKQAWRAGFREGVKLCTRNGRIPPNKKEFMSWVWPTCMRHLNIWHNIGSDIDNGFWSMLGARLGTHYLMLREWNHTEVRDFNNLEKLWDLHKNDDIQLFDTIGSELKNSLDIQIVNYNAEQSSFFKIHTGALWKNQDIMLREIYS